MGIQYRFSYFVLVSYFILVSYFVLVSYGLVGLVGWLRDEEKSVKSD